MAFPSDSRGRAFAITLVSCLMAVPVSGQKQGDAPHAVVNWQADRSLQQRQLRDRSRIRIRIADLAPWCYTYSVSVNQTARTEAPDNRLAALLQGGTDPVFGTLFVPARPAQAETAAGGGGRADARVVVVPPDPLDGVKKQLSLAADQLTAATALFARAAENAKSIGSVRTKAHGAATKYFQGACPAGQRGSTRTVAKGAWDVSKPDVKRFVETREALALARAQFDSAGDATRYAAAIGAQVDALAATNPAVKSYITTGPGVGDATRNVFLVAQLTEQLVAQRDKALSTLAAERASSDTMIARVDSLFTHVADSVDFEVWLKEGTALLSVTVVATGRPFISSISGQVIADAPREFPVTVRARIVPSVGFMLSGLDQNHFVRVTRPRFAGNANLVTDSIYSTYVDAGKSNRVAIAPIVETHVSVADFDHFSTYLSGGVAARTVAGDIGADYVVGASLGFADRALVTLGAHWGRREYLLLGTADLVASRNVPVQVTPESAVGRHWKVAPALALSWRF